MSKKKKKKKAHERLAGLAHCLFGHSVLYCRFLLTFKQQQQQQQLKIIHTLVEFVLLYTVKPEIIHTPGKLF